MMRFLQHDNKEASVRMIEGIVNMSFCSELPPVDVVWLILYCFHQFIFLYTITNLNLSSIDFRLLTHESNDKECQTEMSS